MPVGGGGLIAGIGTAIKAERPDVQVDRRRAGARRMPHRRAGGRAPRRGSTLAPTLADGLAVPQIGELPFAILRSVVDAVVMRRRGEHRARHPAPDRAREERRRGRAARRRWRRSSPASSPTFAGKRVVLVLSGGNIDLAMLDRVIETGLVADGRVARFTVSIMDRPGGLARLAQVIASTGASIKEIMHDRAFSGPDLSAVRVVCVVETTGHEHVERLMRALSDGQITVVG